MTRFALITCLALTCSLAAIAAEPANIDWREPAIPGYGRVAPLPEGAEALSPDRRYRLVFDVTRAGFADEVVPGLEAVARFLNLAALANVPRENLDAVAVLHGGATQAVLKDAAYRELTGEANPNLALIALLEQAGVRVLVCGQALAHQGLDPAQVEEEIEVAVAALTVLANYQMEGYALMPD